MPYSDPRRQQEYQRNYQSVYQKRRYQKRTAELKAKLGGKCTECGSVDELEFHHIDTATKAFSIMEHWKWSDEELAEELAKCYLLCRACHDKHHEDEGGLHGHPERYESGCKCAPCSSAGNNKQAPMV